jgi:hypothetical protein
MTIIWNKKINRVDAAIQLLVDSDFVSEHENMARRLPIIITDAFTGVSGRLNNDEDLKPIASNLAASIRAIRARMNELGLDDRTTLHPILWTRLMQEAGHTPLESVMTQIEKPPSTANAPTKLRLYRYMDSESDKGKGELKEREGFGKVRGYIASELLESKKAAHLNWPYCYEWKTVLKTRIGSPEKPDSIDPSAQQIATTPLKRLKAVKVAHEIAVRPEPLKKRKRRTIEDIRRVCGSGVVDSLEECLEIDITGKKSLLKTKGRNKRRYDSDRSLDELIVALQKKYPLLKNYSDSTLKSALPHFVSCPRGRPKAINAE